MRSLIIVSIFFVGFSAQSQNTGLYGKKICLDFGFSGAIPVFNMIGGYDMYVDKNGQLESKVDMFDYSIRAGAGYAITNNFELGLELDVEFSNIAAPRQIYLDYPTQNPGWLISSYLTHEKLNTRSIVIMPRMSFTSKSGLLPIGLSHQVGVGISLTKIVKKDYLSVVDPVINNYGELPILTNYEDKVYNYENEAFKGLTFMYTLNVRTPINKTMMITYGIRYNFNIGIGGSNYYAPNDYEYSLTETEAYYDVRSRRSRSLISLNIGTSFAL